MLYLQGAIIKNLSDFKTIRFCGNDEEIVNSFNEMIPRRMLLTSTKKIVNTIFAYEKIDLLIITMNSMNDVTNANEMIY